MNRTEIFIHILLHANLPVVYILSRFIHPACVGRDFLVVSALLNIANYILPCLHLYLCSQRSHKMKGSAYCTLAVSTITLPQHH